MQDKPVEELPLPSIRQIRLAVQVYLEVAYGQAVPPTAERFMPDEHAQATQWLMSDLVERDPANAPLAGVRSFALRIGNMLYPHMKLRMSRPPKDAVYLFSVDSHDGFLQASPQSPDYQALEQLKAHNAQVSARITWAWNEHGLPTERNYLREKIRRAAEEKKD